MIFVQAQGLSHSFLPSLTYLQTLAGLPKIFWLVPLDSSSWRKKSGDGFVIVTLLASQGACQVQEYHKPLFEQVFEMHWLKNWVNGSVENQGEADTSLVVSRHHCPDILHTTHTLYPQQEPSVGMALCLHSACEILVPPAWVPTTIDLLREPVQPCE